MILYSKVRVFWVQVSDLALLMKFFLITLSVFINILGIVNFAYNGGDHCVEIDVYDWSNYIGSEYFLKSTITALVEDSKALEPIQIAPSHQLTIGKDLA